MTGRLLLTSPDHSPYKFAPFLGFLPSQSRSSVIVNISLCDSRLLSQGQMMCLSPLSTAARFLVLGAVVVCCGCTSMKTTNTARSSTEQMLVSNAVDQALDKVDFRPFTGHAVFLDEKYVDCVDKAYVIASVRHRLLHVGARLVDKADDAEVVVEPRAGSVGTTNSESYLGIPEITLPGMLALPEVRFLTRSQQVGVAKIGVAAYDSKTRTALGEGGMTLAKSDDTNLSVMGIGPFQSGSIRNEITRSTSGPAAFTRTHIPVQVAFHAPTEIPSAPAADANPASNGFPPLQVPLSDTVNE